MRTRAQYKHKRFPLKAPDFQYAKPETIKEALEILASNEGEVLALAGGQSLMPMLNLRLVFPDILVDLNGLEDMQGIEDLGDVIRLGALTRHVDVEASDVIAKHLPLLARAIKDVAHPAIRHRGTIGGSLALADPAAELPACAVAADAIIVTQGLNGERRLAAVDFFKSIFETALEPGELIIAIEFPKMLACRFAFQEVARRKGDYAMAGVAMVAKDGASLGDVRIVLFGVAAKPVRAIHAEEALMAIKVADIDEARAAEIAEQGILDIGFIDDLHTSEKTKSHLAKVMIKRCVLELIEGDAHG